METAVQSVRSSAMRSPFTNRDFLHFRSLLEGKEKDQLEIQREEVRKMNEREEVRFSDPEDQETRDISAILLNRVTSQLGKIGRAKVRMINQQYGMCMRSPCVGNGFIEKERLEFEPDAEWCMSCAQHVSQGHAPHKRR